MPRSLVSDRAEARPFKAFPTFPVGQRAFFIETRSVVHPPDA
ncbi:hypothetical protein O206_15885 [Ochrobactrum sp. EGD-AQ16]|nr:hypothetical protein O206_15885 [Ochrobactrum sp. EGD-AQ16]